jgi:hypothetical protein
VLHEYLGALQSDLPGLVTALYLHGSVALRAYDPHFSDVDFLALLSRRCTSSDLSDLAEIHHGVMIKYPRPVLDGGYLQWEDIGQTEENIATHPYYHDGHLQSGRSGEINAVMWWLIRNRGVVLLGPDPQELDFEVSGERLRSYTLSNLNEYWVAFVTQPRRISWLLLDDGIQWAVLGVLRQYYTLREQQVVSKVAAGVDALDNLPPKWHRIVQEALNIRQRSGSSLYQNRVGRAIEAGRFLRFIITDCSSRYST